MIKSLLSCVFHILQCKTQDWWSVRYLMPKAASTSTTLPLQSVGPNQFCSVGPVINNVSASCSHRICCITNHLKTQWFETAITYSQGSAGQLRIGWIQLDLGWLAHASAVQQTVGWPQPDIGDPGQLCFMCLSLSCRDQWAILGLFFSCHGNGAGGQAETFHTSWDLGSELCILTSASPYWSPWVHGQTQSHRTGKSALSL